MKSRVRMLCAVSLAATVLILAPSEGRSEEGRLEVGAFIGAHRTAGFELGNAYYEDQVPRGGALFGARVRYRLLAGLGLEFETSFAPTATPGSAEQGCDSMSAPILGLRARASYDVLRWRRFRPFVFAGVGSDTVLISAPESYLVERDTDWSTHWGVGARIPLGGRYGIRTDVRQVLAGGRHTAISTGYEAMAGFYVTFGGSKSRAPSIRIATATGWNRKHRRQATHRLPARGPILPPVPAAAQAQIQPAVMQLAPQPPPLVEVEEPDHSVGAAGDAAQPTLEHARACYKKGSARITRRVRAVLDEVATYLKADPSAIVTIAGHADSEGSDRTNLALSRKRADYAKWYLIDHGVEAYRIDTIGYADTRPLRDNSTASGRAANRRIELNVLE